MININAGEAGNPAGPIFPAPIRSSGGQPRQGSHAQTPFLADQARAPWTSEVRGPPGRSRPYDVSEAPFVIDGRAFPREGRGGISSLAVANIGPEI
jgi:hypothetical protein